MNLSVYLNPKFPLFIVLCCLCWSGCVLWVLFLYTPACFPSKDFIAFPVSCDYYSHLNRYRTRFFNAVSINGPEVYLLCLEQEKQTLEDCVVWLNYYPDRSLCIFYYTSLSERSKKARPPALPLQAPFCPSDPLLLTTLCFVDLPRVFRSHAPSPGSASSRRAHHSTSAFSWSISLPVLISFLAPPAVITSLVSPAVISSCFLDCFLLPEPPPSLLTC